MRRIYEECSRVIAYLGNDLVTESKAHPQYRPLDELHKASTNRELFPKVHPLHASFLGFTNRCVKNTFPEYGSYKNCCFPSVRCSG